LNIAQIGIAGAMVCLSLLVSGVHAQTQPTSQSVPAANLVAPGSTALILADPKKIGLPFMGSSKEDLPLRLQGTSAEKVLFFPPQLTTANGAYRLPLSAVSVKPVPGAPPRSNPNIPADFIVSIDVQGAHSGAYAGDLQIIPAEGGAPLVVPISVQVKDEWYFAMIVLALAVTLSFVLSRYREVGRRRDLLTLRSARIQDLLTNDQELGKFDSFRDQLNFKLGDLSGKLLKEPADFTGAEASANDADAIASRWICWRARWITARTSLETLRTDVNIHQADAELNAATQAFNAAPAAPDPAAFETAVQALATKLNRAAGGGPMPVHLLPNVHFAPRRIAAARLREKAFEMVSVLVALALLYFAGYHELYESNPIFGANGFSDYAALFIWGFGAEASRASVVAAVRSWGIQGFA
jgi:hypothetical protein